MKIVIKNTMPFNKKVRIMSMEKIKKVLKGYNRWLAKPMEKRTYRHSKRENNSIMKVDRQENKL